MKLNSSDIFMYICVTMSFFTQHVWFSHNWFTSYKNRLIVAWYVWLWRYHQLVELANNIHDGSPTHFQIKCVLLENDPTKNTIQFLAALWNLRFLIFFQFISSVIWIHRHNNKNLITIDRVEFRSWDFWHLNDFDKFHFVVVDLSFHYLECNWIYYDFFLILDTTILLFACSSSSMCNFPIILYKQQQYVDCCVIYIECRWFR